MNLVDTDVRHGHGGHRGGCFTGVTIFQRFMFTTQIFQAEVRTVERCLVAVSKHSAVRNSHPKMQMIGGDFWMWMWNTVEAHFHPGEGKTWTI